MNARSVFPTQNANRYLGTLCKHFGHKVPTGLDAGAGWIGFPFGRCDLAATDADLTLTASAPTQEDLDKVKQVVGSHLERFAFREDPSLRWSA